MEESSAFVRFVSFVCFLHMRLTCGFSFVCFVGFVEIWLREELQVQLTVVPPSGRHVCYQFGLPYLPHVRLRGSKKG